MVRLCASDIDINNDKQGSCNSCGSTHKKNLWPGEVLTDTQGKKWKLGKSIGEGGFGVIFLATDNLLEKEVGEKSNYIAKIELHKNGPLFVEINCYLRIGRTEMINEWKSENNQNHLGMPTYIASGSHLINELRYRFIILPRFQFDVEAIIKEKKLDLSLKSVLSMCLQLLDVLEYVHSKGFIHGDIKAANILLAFHKDKVQPRTKLRLRKNARVLLVKRNYCLRSHEKLVKTMSAQEKVQDKLYLLDFGLASKFLLSNGEHKNNTQDNRHAHAGTMSFCSVDAHQGIRSRKSDLESLGYNIIHWLTANLPWHDIEDPSYVKKKKMLCLSHPEQFLALCFGGDYPHFLLNYFRYLQKLECSTKPNYNYCRKLFIKALSRYGYENDSMFEFETGRRFFTKKFKKNNIENVHCKKMAYEINKIPCRSFMAVKPMLRKKNRKREEALKWSKILIDPEIILRQAKIYERKPPTLVENGKSLSSLDINKLNPTPAMLDIYWNYRERSENSNCKAKNDVYLESNLKGFTSAMVTIYKRMKKNCDKKDNRKPLKRLLKQKPLNGKKKLAKIKGNNRIYSLRG